MKTNSEKTELALCSISILWIVKALFEKYAPEFSDGVDWTEISKLRREERKDKVVEIKHLLRDNNATFHN